MHRILLFVFLLTAFSTAVFAQAPVDSSENKPPNKATPAPKWALDRFKLCWDAMKEDSLPERVYQMCWRDLLHTGNIAPFVSTLQSWALDGARSGRPALLRYHSVELLCLFRNDTTRHALRSLIAHRDTLDVMAAKTLVQWGDWEVAAPVLEARDMFDALAVDQRAVPFLRRTLATPDLGRRMSAASALYHLLDRPDSLHYVARQVLALPAAKRNSGITKQAVDLLIKNPDGADLLALEHIVDTDTAHWSQLGAFGALVTVAYAGDSAAFTQLETISRACPDAQIRMRAQDYVIAIRKRARASAALDSTDSMKKRQP